MLEARTIPTATGGVSTVQPSAGRAIGEAITALRRGEPVLIRDHRVGALAVAAEFVTEGTLHRLRERSPKGRRAWLLPAAAALWPSALRRARTCSARRRPRLFPTSGRYDPQSRRSRGIDCIRPTEARPRAARCPERGTRRGRFGEARLASPRRFRASRRKIPNRALGG